MSGPEQIWMDVIREDGRYPPEAFEFLNEGLARAVHHVHGEGAPQHGVQSHVSGRELSFALRDLAVDKWGMLAPTVLGRWNIHSSFDFGQMVYLMIRNGFMQKTEEDSIEDFRDVFDFDKAFELTDEFELKE